MRKSIFLMCPPDHFDIKYSINPWMDCKDGATSQKNKQWDLLRKKFEELGVEVKIQKPHKDWPDMVYVDVGIVYKDVFIPSNFYFPERKGERDHDIKWFKKNNFKIIEIDEEFYFEGHGDTLWAGNNLFFGYGFRSSVEAQYQIAQELKKINKKINIIPVELVNSSFYHLDTCFCPLDDKKAIYYPGAFSKKAIKLMSEYIELIEVTEDEAHKFACNSVVIDNDIVTPDHNSKTNKIFEKLGYRVHPVEMGEFIKGGGACKCLSFYIGNK